MFGRMKTRRSWESFLELLVFFFTLTGLSSAYIHQADQQKSQTGPSTQNNTYISISIDKFLIRSPPEPCCSFQKLSTCRVCTFNCRFRVTDEQNPYLIFIDHQFNCSIETTGQKIKIPLLRQLTTSKINVQMDIFTEKNEQLVGGFASLFVENLEHEPESRILKINIEERYDINFNVSLNCVDGFVGPFCNISCKPPKIGEHHRCSPAGKYCESGYQGENCTEPICTYGCGHGKCIGPNRCSCNPGWNGDFCNFCAPTEQCKSPYFDSKAKRCKCPTVHVATTPKPENSLSDDLKRLDNEYKTLNDTKSTYLTLSVLIIVLLCICALLLVVVIVLIVRNSNSSSAFSCLSFKGLCKRIQPKSCQQQSTTNLANV